MLFNPKKGDIFTMKAKHEMEAQTYISQEVNETLIDFISVSSTVRVKMYRSHF